VRNAAIAIVDEDHSELSQRLRDVFLQPYFKPPVPLRVPDIDAAMDRGDFTFILDIPPKFQADVLARRQPTLQLNVDATAMTLAGNGTLYVQNVIEQELLNFVSRAEGGPSGPMTLAIRAKFNPNLESSWFMAVMQIVNNVTMLSLILSGAAVIREREHGTMEHLLVMPSTPWEIMLAKLWANGLVIVGAVVLFVVVQGALGVTIVGSIPLFAIGTAVFLFAMISLGVVLSTVARSTPQFGLLAIPLLPWPYHILAAYVAADSTHRSRSTATPITVRSSTSSVRAHSTTSVPAGSPWRSRSPWVDGRGSTTRDGGVIGTVADDLADHAVRALLRRHGLSPDIVQRSEIPFSVHGPAQQSRKL
jgi:ABC-type multidrug transport system permease subunit